MTIEKTFKLTIKDTTLSLTEEEVSALHETCRKALNIGITGTNPVKPVKPFDNPSVPTYPTWPTWPTYPGTGNPDPLWTAMVGNRTIAYNVMDSNFTINNSGISPFTNATPSSLKFEFVDPTPNKVS